LGLKGKAEAKVNFTVQVPFDIVEGMRCRALYYGDETFNDAIVVRRSRKGWLVSFVGYEDDRPQDTAVADILAIPAGQAAGPSSPAGGGEREEKGGRGREQTGNRKESAPGTPKTDGGKAGGGGVRAKLGATSPLDGEVLQEGTKCRALFYGDNTFNPASLLRRTRRGWQVVFEGYEQDKPQDTAADDILFPGWAACEALYYGENRIYPALRGPPTSTGFLVGFMGFELDPCQDTLARDITLSKEGRRRERDGRDKRKPLQDPPHPLQQQKPPPPPPQQQKPQSAAAAAAKAAKDRVSDDCVVHVRNLDVQVTSKTLHAFCTMTVGFRPASIRMLNTRPR